jgi:hypothetical protein
MEFNFLDFFLIKTIKIVFDRIHIQTIKFEFKWSNQQTDQSGFDSTLPPTGSSDGWYRLSATARLGSSVDGTAQSERALPLPPL